MGQTCGLISLCVALAGCAPKTAPIESPVADPPAFSGGGDAVMPDRWWTSFRDTALTATVDLALRDNLDLRTAWQRLREAEAVIGIVGGARYPDLYLEVGGVVQRSNAGNVESAALGLSTSYEIDLWGRIDSSVEAERYRARATLADYRTTALSLSAEVVRAWFQLAEARAQTDLLRRQVATNRTSLTLLEARFGTGQIRSADILRQRQLLEATREDLVVAEARLGALRHGLAVLLGRSPTDSLSIRPPGLPEPPPLPATGLPADLVRRRPDVQGAYLRLAGADQDLAAAISNRYPRLSLTASVSASVQSPGRLFDDWLRTLAGNLLAPLFTGGELSAQVDRADARRQQRLYEYGQAVLTAFREVEDALVAEAAQRQRLESLRVQVAFADQTAARLRLEYFNGIGGFLDVLTAQIAQQQLERDLLAAQLGLLESRIALYRALAGGIGAEPTGERPREDVDTVPEPTLFEHDRQAAR
jgi:NodT family efflux transporter outer membrane factor (OMF) lipoprotein